MALSFSILCGFPPAGCGGLWSSVPLVTVLAPTVLVTSCTFSFAASSVDEEPVSAPEEEEVDPIPPPAAAFPLPRPTAEAAVAAAPVMPAPLPLPVELSAVFFPSPVLPNCPVSLAPLPPLMPRYDFTVSIMLPWEEVCSKSAEVELTPPPTAVPREVSVVPGGAVLEAMCEMPLACWPVESGKEEDGLVSGRPLGTAFWGEGSVYLASNPPSCPPCHFSQ